MSEFNVSPAASGPPIQSGAQFFSWGKFNGFILGLLTLLTTISARGQMTDFPLIYGGAGPQGIRLGPDGAFWFTELGISRIGRIDTNGVVTEPFFFLTNTSPSSIIVGPDTNIWFTELNVDKIGRIRPGTNGTLTNGILTEFPIHPGVQTNTIPTCITVGPDNNLWFLEYGANRIGVMDTNGVTLHEYGLGVIATNAQLYNIVSGPDGNLWFTETTYGKIGRITTAGVITEFTLPYSNSEPFDIVVGSDAALWFSEFNSNRIGRLTTTGTYSDFILPSIGTDPRLFYSQQPYYLTLGMDGNIWFTEYTGSKIARITPAGVITEFPTLIFGSLPTGITSGTDGSIWFGEYALSAIGRFIRPTLTIKQDTNSNIILSWPAAATVYTLQGNTNLATTNWVNLTNPAPVVISNFFVYTNSSVGAEFFRLKQ